MLVSNTSTALRLLPIPLVLIIYCIFSRFHGYNNASRYSPPPLVSTNAPPSSNTKAAAVASSTNFTETKSNSSPIVSSFWKDLAIALENARPHCSPLSVEDGHPTDSETTFEPVNTTKRPPDRLVDFTDKHEIALLRAHYVMRTSAHRLAGHLIFSKGKQGIVTTTDTKHIPVSLVSLRMLRRTGCQLPVEVFMEDWTDYDPIICEVILPSLKAACVVLSEITEVSSDYEESTSYRLKPLAILFSSFQHVLFLERDAFPAQDPVALFSTAPYTVHGLVAWPDLFGLAVSEHYYHIAAIPYYSPSSRASTDSGIILMDKDKHRESLLMMVYYNHYGPDYYYPLLCQGSHSAGSKETIIQAAMAVEAPWYQVKTGVTGLGYFEDGEYRLSGMAQMDPRTDYQYKPPSRSHTHPEDRWEAADLEDGGRVPTAPKPMFVHQNMHELDPAHILSTGGTNAKTSDGKYTRMWGDLKGTVKMFGYDIERRMWEVVIEEGCRDDAELESCANLREFFVDVFGLLDSVDE
ncbi:mannosyltransferase [Ascochyta rabiei]|uniref:mannosyltransferase n=1 Tax=Didymella rabiei TaxID=5454 RepID=UPI0019009F6F|nr:mannosyltransferase [Ascochyta rabiei]UPX19786.1 mannosyltransferase [Ascochyta rabiei]